MLGLIIHFLYSSQPSVSKICSFINLCIYPNLFWVFGKISTAFILQVYTHFFQKLVMISEFFQRKVGSYLFSQACCFLARQLIFLFSLFFSFFFLFFSFYFCGVFVYTYSDLSGGSATMASSLLLAVVVVLDMVAFALAVAAKQRRNTVSHSLLLFLSWPVFFLVFLFLRLCL